jgi:hypothetical protein
MPKKCHKCSASVSDDDLFCSRCGTPLGRPKNVPEEDVISTARAVAHRLNNALSTSLTNSQLAMHEIADLPEEISERMKNYLQDIASAATDSGAVVHQFQKFLHSLAGGHSQGERSAYVDFMSFLEKETQADKVHAAGKYTMSRLQVLDAGSKGKNIIATQERVGRISLLIVDDEDRIRHALSYALTLAGYHVMTAPDGQEALRLLQDGAYDIAFVGLKMPGMDGHWPELSRR